MKNLNLENNSLDCLNKEALNILRRTSGFKNLQFLNLSNNGLSYLSVKDHNETYDRKVYDSRLSYFCEFLAKSKNLQQLDLSFNYLYLIDNKDWKDWKELLGTLDQFKDLNSINLSNNVLYTISNDNLQQLCKFIAEHSSLNSIDLSNNKFTKEQSTELVKAFIKNENLYDIKFDGNSIKDEDIINLLKKSTSKTIDNSANKDSWFKTITNGIFAAFNKIVSFFRDIIWPKKLTIEESEYTKDIFNKYNGKPINQEQDTLSNTIEKDVIESFLSREHDIKKINKESYKGNLYVNGRAFKRQAEIANLIIDINDFKDAQKSNKVQEWSEQYLERREKELHLFADSTTPIISFRNITREQVTLEKLKLDLKKPRPKI